MKIHKLTSLFNDFAEIYSKIAQKNGGKNEYNYCRPLIILLVSLYGKHTHWGLNACTRTALLR